MSSVTNSFCTKLLLDATKAYSQCVDVHCRASETLISMISARPESISTIALTRAQVALEASSRDLTRARFLLDSIVAMFDTLGNDQTSEAAQRLASNLQSLVAKHNPTRS